MNLYLASYLLCIGFKKMFEKIFKLLNQQAPNFFLFVLLELWFVYHFSRFLQFFDVGAQSEWGVKMAQNWKIWPLTSINFLHQRGPIKFSFAFAS